MVEDGINCIDNKDEERVIHLPYTGVEYNGHYNVLDLVIKRKAPALKKKLREKLAKTCFKLIYKCAINYRTLEFNPFFMGTLSETCQYCNASYFKIEKNSTDR